MADLSKAACELSIRRLFREAQKCYLWTFTFPDEVEPVEAARRWRLFGRWLSDTDRVCVRVLEAGKRGGKWHYHAVTPNWWDVDEIRPAAERHGFGRINAKEIPADRARYVAKYLRKQNRAKVPPGLRLWACVGFDGVPVSRVRRTNQTFHFPKEQAGTPYTAVECWRGGTLLSRAELRKADQPENEAIQRFDLSEAQIDELLARVSGGFAIFGEYRGLRITKKAVEDSETSERIETNFAEYSIACGSKTETVMEWLPDGVNPKEVPVPAPLGALVVVVPTKVWDYLYQSYSAGKIIPLTGFPVGVVAESHPLSPPVA